MNIRYAPWAFHADYRYAPVFFVKFR